MLRKLTVLACIALAGAAHAQQSAWPEDAALHFVKQCAGVHKDLLAPCRCISDGIIREFSPEDFVKLTDSGAIQRDVRYTRIRNDCVTRAQVRE